MVWISIGSVDLLLGFYVKFLSDLKQDVKIDRRVNCRLCGRRFCDHFELTINVCAILKLFPVQIDNFLKYPVNMVYDVQLVKIHLTEVGKKILPLPSVGAQIR